jgi:hypothetical protein
MEHHKLPPLDFVDAMCRKTLKVVCARPSALSLPPTLFALRPSDSLCHRLPPSFLPSLSPCCARACARSLTCVTRCHWRMLFLPLSSFSSCCSPPSSFLLPPSSRHRVPGSRVDILTLIPTGVRRNNSD